MRTKKTARPAATPVMKAPATPNIKSPSSQPEELSEKDFNKIRNYLDDHEKPFKVLIAPVSRKRKRQSAALLPQTDLFEDRLSVQYEVKPNTWERLRKYRKFTVGTESIAVGQCVLVKHEASDAVTDADVPIDIHAQWKAKVLEVRALDTEHVYIRVAWLNRPEDLRTGRKAYHGKNELIPSNEMDIIDAMAVNGSLEVVHWEEGADDSAMIGDDQFFWRQTYDVNSKTLSELRMICIEPAPHNPDEMILQCSNKACRQWLHVKCIAEAAVQRAFDNAPTGSATKKAAKKRAKPPALEMEPQSQAKANKDQLYADIILEGLPDKPGEKPASKSEIIITNSEDGSKRSEEVCCLVCGEVIE